jgi:predicted hotdog family 3-hydroxylacyl-ACP dehydratase
MAALPPIEELVPHRGAMLLLESVSAAGEASIEAHATVRAGAWYLDADGAMPSWIGIELMAQAAAALAGLNGKKTTGVPPRPGVLLGTRAYRAAAGSFPQGARLLVSARLAQADESGFAAYDCAIRGPDGTLAEATLKVFAPADFGAFIQSAT